MNSSQDLFLKELIQVKINKNGNGFSSMNLKFCSGLNKRMFKKLFQAESLIRFYERLSDVLLMMK